jgi:hypothetical protein
MIGYFARPSHRARAGNRGQATALLLVTVATALAVVFSAILVHHMAVGQVASATSADAVALSAATWEARGLNLIAALNEGTTQCVRIIRCTCVVWASLAIAAAFGAGLPAFLSYTRQARRLISGYWAIARQLVSWSEKIRDVTPYLALAETADLMRKRNIAGILYPANPRGPHDGKNTLELHLESGPPVHLSEAMAPIFIPLQRLRKIPFLKGAAKTVLSALDSAIGGLVGAEGGPIRMLVPEKDFRDRQRVRFAGLQAVPSLPIPFLGELGPAKIPADADAAPYGGGACEMTWKSRLIERTFE